MQWGIMQYLKLIVDYLAEELYSLVIKQHGLNCTNVLEGLFGELLSTQ